MSIYDRYPTLEGCPCPGCRLRRIALVSVFCLLGAVILLLAVAGCRMPQAATERPYPVLIDPVTERPPNVIQAQ